MRVYSAGQGLVARFYVLFRRASGAKWPFLTAGLYRVNVSGIAISFETGSTASRPIARLHLPAYEVVTTN